MENILLPGSESVSMEESGVNLNSPSIIDDELMTALDALEGHADDTIQASRSSELYWIKTVNERDELILENRQTIEELQSLNETLSKENRELRGQLLMNNQGDIVGALQEDAGESRKLSLHLQDELAELQMDVVARLKGQIKALQGNLVKCGQNYSDLFSRLRQERLRVNPNILEICEELFNSKREARTNQEQLRYNQQISELCELYDTVIDGACQECEEYLHSIERLELENRNTRSPPKSRPNMATDEYYMEMLHSSEQSNRELRVQIEQLQKEMNSREQRLFNETMSRIENTNREQTEKMKSQIAELSQELSLLNVDNRALREKILRTENDNESLMKQVSNSTVVSEELKALQSNLDNQLSLNHTLELKVRELELIRMEHSTSCEAMKRDYTDLTEKLLAYENELRNLHTKFSESQELQYKFDRMNSHLNESMMRIQTENNVLVQEVSSAKKEVSLAHMVSEQETRKQSEHEETIMRMKEMELAHQTEIEELTSKLESAEKQHQAANSKVKALRDRLKTMQESWQKVSTNTESSFTALRDQYQQQIKEYKSIIDSLKSQNSSLGSRIESLKKVSAQNNSSQVANLEQQISEYKSIMDGYREENVLLRKELSLIIASIQDDDKAMASRDPKPDEFARLKDILDTAKSECQSLQLHKTSHSIRAKTANGVSTKIESASPNKYNSSGLESGSNRKMPAARETGRTTYTADKPWSRYRAAQVNRSKCLEPLAVSTPRSTKEESLSSHRISLPVVEAKPPEISMSKLDRTPLRLAPSRQDLTSGYSSGQPGGRSSLDNPSNLRYEKLPISKSAVSAASTADISKVSTDAAGSRNKPAIKKEVIEIKHRNSADLDPSKAFKPINPDSGTSTVRDSGKYQPISPYKSSAYRDLSSQSLGYRSTADRQPYAAYSRSYHTRPGVTSYEPSTYKSKYTGRHESKVAADYKNISTDSAYGSPSRSFSKISSVSSYTNPYKKDYNLYTAPYTHSKSMPRNDNSLSEQLKYESQQTEVLNRTLDNLEISMDSYSSVTRADKHMLDVVTEPTSSRYVAPYVAPRTSTDLNFPTNLNKTTQYIASALGSSHKIATPHTFTFHGSVVYDSIY